MPPKRPVSVCECQTEAAARTTEIRLTKNNNKKQKKANKQQKETSVAATIRQAANETRTKTTLIPVSRGAYTSDRKHDMNEKTTT